MGRHQATVSMNSAKVAEAVSGMRKGGALQEAVGRGAEEQHRADSAQAIDVLTVTTPAEALHWDDLIGGALSTEEAGKASMGAYGKVPLEAARGGGHKALGVRWVGVKKAHLSRLAAKGINAYNAPDLFVATPPMLSLMHVLRIAPSSM